MKEIENKYDGYTDLLISRSPIRAFIRRHFYIRNILKFIKGKTIDFGCGVGEVLKYLPAGSLGIDPDKNSIRYCKTKGLNAKIYDSEKSNYQLEIFKGNNYSSILLNHVLEHIPSPKKRFNTILAEAAKINIERIVIAVPCKLGFLADETHMEHIDSDFFNNIKSDKYKIIHKEYYPINNKFIGNFFRYQELVVVYKRNI